MVVIKSSRELQQMKEACRISANALVVAGKAVEPGVSTLEIDTIVRKYIEKEGATPSFLGYGGFPASACISVNNVVIHGIPSKKQILKEGDIVSVDCGACINGFHGDAARTFPVGNISKEAQRLIDVTRDSFFKGIEYAKVGNRLSDISHEIQSYVEAAGFSVVRDFVGHGIGRNVHEDPNVPNFGKSGRGPKLQEGMVLAIEPMVNAGTYKVTTLKDGWTVVTADNYLSAHYENTVAILSDGPEILTLIK